MAQSRLEHPRFAAPSSSSDLAPGSGRQRHSDSGSIPHCQPISIWASAKWLLSKPGAEVASPHAVRRTLIRQNDEVADARISGAPPSQPESGHRSSVSFPKWM